jgi:CBS domain-containing protein
VYEFLEYRVCDVMSQPIHIAPRTSLAEAEELLEKHGFNALPVVDEAGRLVGVMTSLDLLAAFRSDGESTLPSYERNMGRPVSDVMSRDPQTVTSRAPLTRVLEKMVQTRNKSFPVEEDGRLVGVVAREDVMRALRHARAGAKPSSSA